MKPGDLLHDIFQREIKRLHEQSLESSLDVSDLVRLEKLVSSYRKFMPSDPAESDELDNLSTQELLSQINADSARASSAAPSKDSALEKGRDKLVAGRDPDGDED